jgi:hypothetical protein
LIVDRTFKYARVRLTLVATIVRELTERDALLGAWCAKVREGISRGRVWCSSTGRQRDTRTADLNNSTPYVGTRH